MSNLFLLTVFLKSFTKCQSESELKMWENIICDAHSFVFKYQMEFTMWNGSSLHIVGMSKSDWCKGNGENQNQSMFTTKSRYRVSTIRDGLKNSDIQVWGNINCPWGLNRDSWIHWIRCKCSKTLYKMQASII